MQKKSLLPDFIKGETISGIFLIISTLVALVWANSDYSDSYHHFWHEQIISFSISSFNIQGSFHTFINDGLMAIFFFVIGLEIKREVIGGELKSIKSAAMPITAALGGMLIPALIFTIFNYTNPSNSSGWGIPMATDIAFALGIMSLLGKKVPLNLKVFLTALAIADDLGAIVVIALFYTSQIHFEQLIIASVALIVLATANIIGVRKTSFYAIIGIVFVWLAFFYSGVHATIAGVLVAFVIPARPKINEETYLKKIKKYIDTFFKTKANDNRLLTNDQYQILEEIEKINSDALTPLQRLEHALHPYTSFVILPLFALANAGVHFDGGFFNLLIHPIALGVIFGLVLGKLIGISLFSELVYRLKLGNFPEGVNRKHIIGAGLLAGIGFTMSIFISDLAFQDAAIQVQAAKAGIFAASIIAALLGSIVLLRIK